MNDEETVDVVSYSTRTWYVGDKFSGPVEHEEICPCQDEAMNGALCQAFASEHVMTKMVWCRVYAACLPCLGVLITHGAHA